MWLFSKLWPIHKLSLTRTRRATSFALLGSLLGLFTIVGCETLKTSMEPVTSDKLTSEEKRALSDLMLCAGGLNLGLSAGSSLSGSLIDILRKDGTSFAAQLKILRVQEGVIWPYLPESDREKAYEKYVECTIQMHVFQAGIPSEVQSAIDAADSARNQWEFKYEYSDNIPDVAKITEYSAEAVYLTNLSDNNLKKKDILRKNDRVAMMYCLATEVGIRQPKAVYDRHLSQLKEFNDRGLNVARNNMKNLTGNTDVDPSFLTWLRDNDPVAYARFRLAEILAQGVYLGNEAYRDDLEKVIAEIPCDSIKGRQYEKDPLFTRIGAEKAMERCAPQSGK